MASVTEADLGDGYIKVTLAGRFHLVLQKDCGFFNATKLCELENKLLPRYNSLERTYNLKTTLRTYFHTSTSRTTKNKNIAGMYFHPALMLDLALWISPEVYARTAAIIMAEIFHEEARRKSKAFELFRCGEIAECTNIDRQKWRIQYDKVKLIVNERGYFDSTSLNSAHQINFEGLKNYAPLIKYLQDRELFDQSYYHPLLFLYWAIEVDTGFYVKWVCLIFGCTDERLHSLFREAIKAAATGISLEAESTVEPHQSSSKPNRFDAKPQPLIESVGSSSRQPNFMDIQDIAELESDEDSDLTMDTADEADLFTQEQVDIKLAQLKCELEKTIEEEREAKFQALAEKEAALGEKNVALMEKEAALMEKEVALMREREKDKELKRLKKQKRDRDEEYMELLRKFEKLHVRIMQLQKLPRRQSRVNTAANIAKDSMDVGDVAKQECLVLFELTTGEISGARGQLKYTLKAIQKQLDNIAEFAGWYVCENAIKVFSSCKSIVEEKARILGHDVHVSAGKIHVVNNAGTGEFDITDNFCKMLRVKFDVDEADVRILGKLFNKKVRSNEYVLPSDPKKASLLKKVHEFIEYEYKKATKWPAQ